MSRKTIEYTDKDKTELIKICNGRKVEKRLSERARIILFVMEGKKIQDIAKELSLTRRIVAKWRDRFIKHGISGLKDAARSGKPPKYKPELRNEIFKILERKPPAGQVSWDGESIAREVGASKAKVWRILRKEGIQLQRMRSWCVSTDKEFTVKSADIVGLYLNPPENALVICVDEKPSIQALERKTGYVETSSKKIVRGLQNTYKKHGVLNLFAALNVATGEVQASVTQTKKREDFLVFMDNIVKDVSKEQEIHVILDNYSTHKSNEDWLRNHPNVKFHYTPTSASWLNQVEIWFGIMSRKALRGASFESTEELKLAIERFVTVYHQNARPFIWKKREVKGSQLRNKITNLCN